MNEPKEIQIVDLDDKVVLCQKCNTNLSDNSNFTYLAKRWNKIVYTDDLCKCKQCKSKFLLRFKIYDKEGHVDLGVLVERPDGVGLKWLDSLSITQKDGILQHLKKCQSCREKINKKSLNHCFGNKKIITIKKNY